MSTDADGDDDDDGVPTTLPPQPTSPLLPRAGKNIPFRETPHSDILVIATW